jgi:hypothetical protein
MGFALRSGPHLHLWTESAPDCASGRTPFLSPWRRLGYFTVSTVESGPFCPLTCKVKAISWYSLCTIAGHDDRCLSQPWTQGVEALHPNRFSWFFRIGTWAVAGAVVLLAIAVGVTAVALPGCESCHWSGQFKADSIEQAHAKVACVRCHVKGDAGSRLSYAAYEILHMQLRIIPGKGRAGSQVSNSTCLSCHQAVNTRITQVKGLRIQHSKCAKGSMCTDCHSTTAHGASVKWQRTSHMEACLDCHVPNKVREACTTCHGSEPPADALATGPWYVTHGPEWRTTHGMGDWNTCAACHAPDFCVKCHHIPLPHDVDFVRTHGATALTQRSDCTVCHQESFCKSCHGLEMPHPASFAPTHPDTVHAMGQSACLKCHVSTDCETCHVKHVHPGGVLTPPKVSQ